jgi:hypothetical protein
MVAFLARRGLGHRTRLLLLHPLSRHVLFGRTDSGWFNRLGCASNQLRCVAIFVNSLTILIGTGVSFKMKSLSANRAEDVRISVRHFVVSP